MAESRIPLDLFNPGQVFACLGFLEAAEVLLGEAAGGFDWSDDADVRFVLRAAGDVEPAGEVLGFLAGAEVRSLAPEGSSLSTLGSGWKVPTEPVPDATFPFPVPDAPATLPVVLVDPQGRRIGIEHWGDATRRDAAKFWAGAGGYPGAALARDALGSVRDRILGAASDPFALAALQSSSFRFDWRRDYVPLDLGFSPNGHASMTMLGYPLVELLAAVGLQNARPERIDRLNYRYAAVGTPLPAMLLRAALGRGLPSFPCRVFRMRLDWPGQEGQARCIVDVIEEPGS